MPEDLPRPSLPTRCLLLTIYVGMLIVAGLFGAMLGLVPVARREKLSPRAERFYGFCVLVAELNVAFLVHVRCSRRSVAAVRCPRCGGEITTRFDPSGKRLSLKCASWHVASTVPVLVSPPSWWNCCIERPWWEEDSAERNRAPDGSD